MNLLLKAERPLSNIFISHAISFTSCLCYTVSLCIRFSVFYQAHATWQLCDWFRAELNVELRWVLSADYIAWAPFNLHHLYLALYVGFLSHTVAWSPGLPSLRTALAWPPLGSPWTHAAMTMFRFGLTLLFILTVFPIVPHLLALFSPMLFYIVQIRPPYWWCRLLSLTRSLLASACWSSVDCGMEECD